MLPLCKFEIDRIVNCRAKDEALDRCPGLARRLGIERDRKIAQKAGQRSAAGRVESSPSLGRNQSVQDCQRPVGSGLTDAIERGRRRRPLVLGAPRQRHGAIEDEAHGRPSLMKSVILSPPRVTPRLASGMPAITRRALSRSKPGSAEMSRATGRAWRLMTISSPCSSCSSNGPSLFFGLVRE